MPQVRKALQALPCVRKVEVSFTEARAKVTVETAQYEPGALVKALEAAGFGGKAAKQKGAEEPKAKTPAGLRVSFHVGGLMKTKSGAT